MVDPEALQTTLAELREALDESGPLGVELSSLDDYQRAAAVLLDEATVDGGRLRVTDAADPLIDHPFVAALEATPFAPPAPEGVDRAELRELVRRGRGGEEGGIFFASSAVEAAGRLAGRLLADNPDGFTVSAFREAAANTCKHTMPLLARLDNTGVTRRRDDVRIAGPRLPKAD